MNAPANIPAPSISHYSPVWQFLRSDFINQMRIVPFANDMALQTVATLHNPGGGGGLFPPEDIHELARHVDIGPELVERLTNSEHHTMLLMHRDHMIARHFGEQNSLSTCIFNNIVDHVKRGYPQGEFNLVYVEGNRFVVYEPQELKDRLSFYMQGTWFDDVGFFPAPVNIPAAIALEETPLGYLLRATQLDLIDKKDLSQKIVEQTLFSLGTSDNPVRIPVAELEELRDMLAISHEEYERLMNAGDNIVMLFAHNVAVPEKVVGSHGYAPYNIGNVMVHWLQPDIGDRASIIYFENRSQIAMTFNELAGKGKLLISGAGLVEIARNDETPIKDSTWRPHDLNDDQIDRINAAIAEYDWFSGVDIIQDLAHNQWMHQIIFVPNGEMKVDQKADLQAKLESVASKIVDIFEGLPFSMRFEADWPSTSRTASYATRQQMPPGPELGL